MVEDDVIRIEIDEGFASLHSPSSGSGRKSGGDGIRRPSSNKGIGEGQALPDYMTEDHFERGNVLMKLPSERQLRKRYLVYDKNNCKLHVFASIDAALKAVHLGEPHVVTFARRGDAVTQAIARTYKMDGLALNVVQVCASTKW